MCSLGIVTNLPYHIEYPRARLLITNVNNSVSMHMDMSCMILINMVAVSFGKET